MYQVQEETKGILIEQEKRIPFVVRYAGKLLLYINSSKLPIVEQTVLSGRN
ncbi:MAG: hypothetical protein OEZ36_05815 [Spirochaetota bacterium]|nr:hypothetical protein [Spirochaetota bacterium]